MSDNGVRPRKLWHYGAIALVVATIYHNPGGSAELAISALDGGGTMLGWMLDRGGMDGESHYFEDPNNGTGPDQSSTPEPGREVGPPVTIAGTDETGSSPLRGTADQAVVEVVRLHEIVEAVLADDVPERDRFDT